MFRIEFVGIFIDKEFHFGTSLAIGKNLPQGSLGGDLLSLTDIYLSEVIINGNKIPMSHLYRLVSSRDGDDRGYFPIEDTASISPSGRHKRDTIIIMLKVRIHRIVIGTEPL
jgi:hypothetical protein